MVGLAAASLVLRTAGQYVVYGIEALKPMIGLAMPAPPVQSEYLSILTHAPSDVVKDVAEAVLPHIGEIAVLKSQTGLVMLSCRDSAEGVVFHLGEVLVSEAHIRLSAGVEGYGMVTGRDLVQAMAVAVLDAALTAGIMTAPICDFIAQQAAAQRQADDDLLRLVEATRVEMETF